MKIVNYLSLLFIVPMSLYSCNWIKHKPSGVAIARVYNKTLYRDDIKQLVSQNKNVKDSAIIVNNYINKWVKQQLMLHQAELNLHDDEGQMAKKIEDYKNSLLIYSYQKEFVKQKLDTVITNEQVKSYFEEYQQNFFLKDDIVRGSYLKLDKNTPDLDRLKKWYKSDEEEDFNKLEEYCIQYAISFFLDTNKWIYFNDFKERMILKIDDNKKFLKKNKYFETEDENNLYFLRVNQYVVKDSLAPVSFETNKIKSVLLNKRKMNLIKKTEKEMYQDAFTHNDIELFN